MARIAGHDKPSWGEKANLLIHADLSQHDMPGCKEQLWARKIANRTFEICCIPYFTYGIFLGDTVTTDGDYVIQRVSGRGGHKSLRVAVADQQNVESIHIALHGWVESTGLQYEWCAIGYLAVDLPPSTDPERLLQQVQALTEREAIAVEIDGN